MSTTRSVATVIAAVTGLLAAGRGGEPAGYKAEELQPRSPGQAVFRLTQDDKTRVVHAEFRADGGQEDEATRWVYARASVISDVMELREGQWVMTEARVEYEDSRVLFDPPAILLPAELREGRSARQSGTVEVYKLKSGKHVTSGKFARCVELRGRRTINGPDGPIDAVIVRITEAFKFPHAKATVVTIRAYAPGKGVVYERAQDKVTKIGVLKNERSLKMELQEAWRPPAQVASP